MTRNVPKHYEKSMHGIFLIFCMKLQKDKYLKLTLMICWEKNFWAQNEVFTVLAKAYARNFSNFLHEVTAA